MQYSETYQKEFVFAYLNVKDLIFGITSILEPFQKSFYFHIIHLHGILKNHSEFFIFFEFMADLLLNIDYYNSMTYISQHLLNLMFLKVSTIQQLLIRVLTLVTLIINHQTARFQKKMMIMKNGQNQFQFNSCSFSNVGHLILYVNIQALENLLSKLAARVNQPQDCEKSQMIPADKLLTLIEENKPLPRMINQEQVNNLSKISDENNTINNTFQTIKFKSKLIQSNFVKVIKAEKIKQQFINNLFTNTYILKQNKKLLIYDKYIEENNIQPILDTYTQSRIPVIQPTCGFIIIWNAVGIIFNFIILWLTPFLLSFQQHQNEIQLSSLSLSIMIFLISDILISQNKGIIIQGILKRRTLIQKYIQTNFTNDILNLILWILIQQNLLTYQVFGECLTLAQLIITYKKIDRYLSDYFEFVFFKGISNSLMDLLSLILSIYLLAHIVACFYHYVGVKSMETSWLIKYVLLNEPIRRQYNYAFYWATMTMTTIEYGDVTAQSQLELIFVDIIMFLSSGVFVYSMNQIGIILKNLQDSKLKYKRSILKVNTFMNKNQVEPTIQSRIRNQLNTIQIKNKIKIKMMSTI